MQFKTGWIQKKQGNALRIKGILTQIKTFHTLFFSHIINGSKFENMTEIIMFAWIFYNV